MRGRVMSLWFVAFQGSTPIGGPIIGWSWPRPARAPASALGAVTCVVAALGGAVAMKRLDDSRKARRYASSGVVGLR